MRIISALILLLITFAPVFGQPTVAVAAALNDQRTNPLLAPHVRHLQIKQGTGEEKLLQWQTISALLHGQSRNRQIYPPQIVLTSGEVKHVNQMKPEDWASASLIRVDLNEYHFSVKTWDELGFQDPYFHLVVQGSNVIFSKDKDGNQIWKDSSGAWNYSSKVAPPKVTNVLASAPWLAENQNDANNITALLTITQCQTPILRADNFIWQIAISKDRKVGYYGLLEIKNQKDFEKVIGFDPKANVDPSWFDEILAAVVGNNGDRRKVDGSRVAIKNRRIERRQGFSPYWITKDNAKTEKEENNPLRTLNGTLKYPAVETYGKNSTGFWVTGLFVGNQPLEAGQKEGDRQDTAPDFIGYDHTSRSNDGKIHVGMSCVACHTDGGLQDINCWFRKIHQFRPLQTTDPRRIEALEHYKPDLTSVLREDRDSYNFKLRMACGMTAVQFASALGKLYNEYDSGVSVDRAASDIGITADDLIKRLDAYTIQVKLGDTVLSMYTLPKKEQSALHIDDYHQSYNLLQLSIRGYSIWPVLK